MTPAIARVAAFATALAAAVGAFAQQPAFPLGNWRSAASDVYTSPLHPVLTGAEFYLEIDVSDDGSFRGAWGRYSCSGVTPGAFGINTFPCRFSGTREPATGRFGPGGQGVIELGKFGRAAFSWDASTADLLAIDLPKNWRGDAVLYRARLTRAGQGRPAPARPSADDAGPLLSANALYREFNQDSATALARYAGRTLVLEGRRGTLIPLSDGGAAIHIADGFTSRALVLVFKDLSEVGGIDEGAQFRFSCTVESFDYLYVHLEDCSVRR
jgi:hypothetical protein